MLEPKITVLTSCYNAARFLPEAIESILAQTSANFEFILIDDGSTDETLGIIKCYAAKDNRIVVIGKDNTGLANSLNLGLALAKGDWIARLDADDVALPDRFEKQADHIRDHDEVVLLGTGCVEIDEAGREIKSHTYPMQHSTLVRHLEIGGSPFPHSSALFRRDVAQHLGGYRVRLKPSLDTDLWLRMGSIGRIGCLHQPLIRLRKHGLSMTGMNQRQDLAFSYTARVSHLLRKQGYADPVEQEEQVYQGFVQWVEDRLEQEKVFETARIWAEIRQRWYSSSDTNTLSRYSSLAQSLIRSGHGLELLRHRLLSSDLVARLVQEWIHAAQG
jgi:glycosyltransferase involved in cell wall biosynthesis